MYSGMFPNLCEKRIRSLIPRPLYCMFPVMLLYVAYSTASNRKLDWGLGMSTVCDHCDGKQDWGLGMSTVYVMGSRTGAWEWAEECDL